MKLPYIFYRRLGQMVSLQHTLPRQQQEPGDWQGPGVGIMVAPRPGATRSPQVAQQLCRPSTQRAIRPVQAGAPSRGSSVRGGGRAPPPGSAAASASQVEALLERLEELESDAVEQRQLQEELKQVWCDGHNVALHCGCCAQSPHPPSRTTTAHTQTARLSTPCRPPHCTANR